MKTIYNSVNRRLREVMSPRMRRILTNSSVFLSWHNEFEMISFLGLARQNIRWYCAISQRCTNVLLFWEQHFFYHATTFPSLRIIFSAYISPLFDCLALPDSAGICIFLYRPIESATKIFMITSRPHRCSLRTPLIRIPLGKSAFKFEINPRSHNTKVLWLMVSFFVTS